MKRPLFRQLRGAVRSPRWGLRRLRFLGVWNVGLSRREQQRLEYERRLAAAQQEHELRQQQRVLDVLERLLQAERERSQRMLEQAEKIPTGAGVRFPRSHRRTSLRYSLWLSNSRALRNLETTMLTMRSRNGGGGNGGGRKQAS
jgi:hypothetical protein